MADPAALAVLQLVADPQRWQILQLLGESDRRVGELVVALDRAQSVVSYHLAELRRAGLVTSRRSSADGRDTYYALDVARLADALVDAGGALHAGLRLVPAAAPPVRTTDRPRPKVLFLCTGNSARSQMAEALVEARSDGAVEAKSAGSHPKPLHPNAVRAMAARGIDLQGRTSKSIDRFARSRFDRVITLCDKVREVCPELPGDPATAHWSIADPAAGGDDDDATYPAFEALADQLETRVALLLADLDARPLERTRSA